MTKQSAIHDQKVNKNTKTGLEEAETKQMDSFTLQSHKSPKEKTDAARRGKTTNADTQTVSKLFPLATKSMQHLNK